MLIYKGEIKMTSKNLIEILSGSLNISAKDTKDSFKRQFLFNKLFKSKYISKILCLLYKIPTLYVFHSALNLEFFSNQKTVDSINSMAAIIYLLNI